MFPRLGYLVVTQGCHVLQRRLSPLFSPELGSTSSEVLRYDMSYNAAFLSDDWKGIILIEIDFILMSNVNLLNG